MLFFFFLPNTIEIKRVFTSCSIANAANDETEGALLKNDSISCKVSAVRELLLHDHINHLLYCHWLYAFCPHLILFSKGPFYIILLSIPTSSKLSRPFRFPNQTIVCISHFSHAFCMPHPSHPP